MSRSGARGAMLPALDGALAPAGWLAGTLLRRIRQIGLERLPRTREALDRAGVYPLIDHYYEPLFRQREIESALQRQRRTAGVDLGTDRGLALLANFSYQQELMDLADRPHVVDDSRFRFQNTSFGPGDAEALYCMIRTLRPKHIIEIGSGHSTRLMVEAIRANEEAGHGSTEVTCIEPYENHWLEQLPVEVVRERVETLPDSVLARLQADDILFIDSSHMIRPGGDVLVEYLEILPRVPVGVVVHVHDIFTPRDYPRGWLVDQRFLWNEQYLLEAFLIGNSDFEVLLAANHLANDHRSAFGEAFPVFGRDPGAHQPGSFWMRRVR